MWRRAGAYSHEQLQHASIVASVGAKIKRGRVVARVTRGSTAIRVLATGTVLLSLGLLLSTSFDDPRSGRH
jgi:hypothetical protein